MTDALEARLARLPNLHKLVSARDEDLDRGAERVRQAGRGMFPWAWAEAVGALDLEARTSAGASATAVLAPLYSSPSPEYRRLLDSVVRYVDEALPPPGDPADVAEARRRILLRAATSDFQAGALVQRRSRWRNLSGRVADTVQTIEADSAEQLIVPLLALIRPDAQFSVTPRSTNRVFACHKGGYHRTVEERVYVTGLSDVLDTVSDIVQAHRLGVGGRIHITEGAVRCPDCHCVIAWVNEPVDGRPVAQPHES